MRVLKYISILAIVLIALLYVRQNSSPYKIIKGEVFGTYYSIKIKTKDNINELKDKIQVELENTNKHMSVFEEDSEINKINNAEAGIWIPISPSLSSVLRNSQKVYEQSQGAFDPTVGKLVELWGFGVNKEHVVPSSKAIKDVLSYTGLDKIKFNYDFSQLKKEQKNTYINLSAIAKGYGVDKVAQVLQQNGYYNFIIDIGGEVRVSGRRSKKLKGWKVGVASPQKNNPHNVLIVALRDYSVATSGDYRNFFTKDNKKFSHTISSKTGYPVENDLTSVTVFHKECMLADAYATAIMALGGNKGLKLANKLNLAVVLLVKAPNDEINMLFSNQAKELIGD